MSDLTYKEAADYLNVSPATIRNWTRQGVLTPSSGSKIPLQSVDSFKKKLSSGKTKRLTRRANKQSAKGTFIPEEYLPDRSDRTFLSRISESCLSRETDPLLAVYAYFRILSEKLPDNSNPLILQELESWSRKLDFPSIEGIRETLELLHISELPDPAGFLYQMFQKEGRKSILGSYYTPPDLAEKILHFYKGKWKTFLDPCCGSGIYLMTAARLSGNPQSITGWDTD